MKHITFDILKRTPCILRLDNLENRDSSIEMVKVIVDSILMSVRTILLEYTGCSIMNGKKYLFIAQAGPDFLG